MTSEMTVASTAARTVNTRASMNVGSPNKRRHAAVPYDPPRTESGRSEFDINPPNAATLRPPTTIAAGSTPARERNECLTGRFAATFNNPSTG